MELLRKAVLTLFFPLMHDLFEEGSKKLSYFEAETAVAQIVNYKIITKVLFK